MTAIEISVVDAFTAVPFRGNPAAVCRLAAWPSDEWLQSVATEMNLSETAFVVPRADGEHDLRWFTPAAEVALCGHATLATAHVLAPPVGVPVRFHTRSGVLTCTRVDGGGVEMDFPADPVTECDLPERLAGSVSHPRFVGRGREKLLVELADAASVRAYEPDLAAIAAVDAQGLVVTASGDRQGVDCVSRFFAPRVGVPEDPVTGSAHCTLASYWAPRLGRSTLVGEQASRRGGIVRMRLDGERVVLAGDAVTITVGHLLAEPPR